MSVCSHQLIAMLRRMATALATILAAAVALSAAAHDIPNDVKINVFIRPAGNRLELLIRVPLSAMIEVDFPTRGAGYLDLSRADEALRGATKLYLTDNITVYENEAPLPTPRVAYARVSLPSDKSFASYEEARAHVQGPRLADDLDLYWNQQLLDVLVEYPIQSESSEFAIHPRGDPGLVRLDPRWHQAASSFVVMGFWHILEGNDHLLFLACLVIPFRRLRPLVIIVTSFTVAHSISLIASAFGFVPDALWFPPLIETLIAATIIYMALENIVGSDISRRWIIAFAFGLVHGFGFSFALRESFQFAGDYLVTSLFAFNIGVEIGQLVVLLVLIPALGLLFRYVVAERLGIIILSAFVAHTAWHWMIERGEQLAKFPLPSLDAAFIASAMRGLIAALILAGGVALVNGFLKRWIEADGVAPVKEIAE